jgi:hypothetical protein
MLDFKEIENIPYSCRNIERPDGGDPFKTISRKYGNVLVISEINDQLSKIHNIDILRPPFLSSLELTARIPELREHDSQLRAEMSEISLSIQRERLITQRQKAHMRSAIGMLQSAGKRS